MYNKLNLTIIFGFTLFVIYSCNDSGPTIDNTNTTGNHAPELPKNPFPHNDTTNVPRYNLTVSWTCEDPDAGDTVKFDIKMANINPPDLTLVSNITTPYYAVPFLLAADTTFYWRVVAKDNHGAVTSGSIWKFTTGLTD